MKQLCDQQLVKIGEHYSVKNVGPLTAVVSCPQSGEDYNVYDVKSGEDNAVRFYCSEHRTALWKDGGLDNDVEVPGNDVVGPGESVQRYEKALALNFEEPTQTVQLISLGAVLFLSGILGFFVIPFKESAGWGLAVLFVPFAFVAFWMKSFKQNIPAFIISVLGIALMIAALYLA